MSLFNKLKTTFEEITHSSYIDVIDKSYCLNRDSVYFNEDDNLEELQYQDGLTYSGYIRDRSTQADCVFFNIDSGCGETITWVFRKDKEVKFDG